MLPSIMKRGLTMGKLILKMPPDPRFMSGCQWLTINPDFDQSWCQYGSLPYDRTANRLNIEIPDRPARYLLKWTEKGQKLAGKEIYDILSEFGDPENWYIFKGIIKPEWIKKVTVKLKMSL